MADVSLSLDELIRKLMGDGHADVLRETLAWFVSELMEAEVAGQIGAERHAKTPEGSATATATASASGAPAPARSSSPSRA